MTQFCSHALHIYETHTFIEILLTCLINILKRHTNDKNFNIISLSTTNLRPFTSLFIFVKLEFFFVNTVNALLAKTGKVTSKRVKELHKYNHKMKF